MAEALIAVRDGVSMALLPGAEGGTGSVWRWALGHVVDVKEDGADWGALGDPRNFATTGQRRFALLLFPGVSVARVQRYLAAQMGPIDQFTGQPTVVRKRLWQIQWNALPAAARTILATTGVLTIGPTGDFTWTQVQNFVTRMDTGASDTEPLT